MARSRSPKEQKNGSGASQAAECSGMSLEGRRALVTGGSKGIGRATAELLLKLGAEVAICARGDSELQAVRTSSGAAERCHAIVADLSTEEGVKDLMAKLPWKELDILVNNCGTNIRKRAEDFEPEEFRKIFDTNFMSSMWLSRAALPLLKSAAEKGKPGGAAVVNISSVAGRTHIPSGFPYAASKAAMDQMTRNLAVEWARFGIRVNAVAPGVIETPLIKTASPIYVADFKERKPLSRMGQVNEIARPIAFLASESASFITGQILVVDGGFTATCFNKVPSYWEDQ
ncbi:Tropinone reductase homolog At5g06060 [Durusdinium trenchii]|uniref:Tropinone reductase homolog At5g06060 n=1 Tax=Durusdinium trenchii TaxID=1381693 RepID=A0ABP0PDZ8_9DINO